MSVINRMLIELEERHDDAVQKHLPGIVRAVPARLPPTMRRPWLILIVGLAVLIPLVAWQVAAIRKSRVEKVSSPPAIPQPVRAITEPQLKVADQLLPAPMVSPEPEQAAATAAPLKAQAESEPARQAAVAGAKPLVTTKPDSITAHKKSTPEAAPKWLPSAELANTADFKQESKEQRADNRYREALALIAQGRLQEAQAALEEMLRAEPRNLSARQVLLGIHVEAKRYAQAEQLLQEGLQLNLPPATQAMALARIQFERGDQTAALATLEKYAPQAVSQGEYAGFHAALLQHVGRHAEAITQFQAALKVHPNQSNWLMGLGISLQAEKRYPEAEHAYLRARAGNALAPDLQAFVEQRLRQVQQLR